MKHTVANKLGEDPTLPNVELVIGGKTLKLCYDFNAVVKAEEQTGLNLLSAVVGNIDARSLRGLLWASVIREHPALTIEEVGKLIRPTSIATIRQAITSAWFGSLKDQDEDAGEVEEMPRA